MTLPPDAEDRSVSMGRANAMALLGWLPLCTLLLAPFAGMYGGRVLWEGFLGLFGLPQVFGVLVVGTLTHEALHALAWKLATGHSWHTIRLGFQWKTLTPYAHSRAPMSARAYLIGAITPGLVLGLLPLGASYATGNGAWAAFGWLFLVAAGGDALIVWLLRDVDGRRLVADHPTQAGCLLL